jgi:hypothetical protein
MFDGMQPKFQWLVPLLDQHYVAQEVVKAVKREQLFLVGYYWMKSRWNFEGIAWNCELDGSIG